MQPNLDHDENDKQFGCPVDNRNNSNDDDMVTLVDYRVACMGQGSCLYIIVNNNNNNNNNTCSFLLQSVSSSS
jgi:hypothetical protein